MGERTTISGHIQEPYYIRGDAPQLRLLGEANWRVIQSLPDTDLFLPRRMFVRSAPDPTLRIHVTTTFRGRVIYFGGSFSSLFADWNQWLQQFESLLKRTYWEHAAAIVVTEWMGTHHYFWKAALEAHEQMAQTPPLPVTQWGLTTSPNPL